MHTIKILIADDHAVLRSGLKALFHSLPDLEVVGEAADGASAITLAATLRPDVIVMDVSMPGIDGIEAIKEIRRRNLPCRILVLTMHDEEEYVREIMLAGADGFVAKKSADTELIAGIRKVAAGTKYLNEALSQNLLSYLLHSAAFADPPDSHDPYRLLSVREREVLRLLAQGHANVDIAAALSISPKTVDTYRSRLMAKLGCNKKSELVNYAIQHKLIKI
ncbi:MAG: response regulator transcription factor [Negativicutes bacterium]|nr:response regulator transcription factor [Negativicutes bacterium]